MAKLKSTSSKSPAAVGATLTASALIDARIAELGDWRGAILARIRRIIRAADPGVVEEWKWRGVPVWSHDGIICTGETYKEVVKMTFAKGASLDDPKRLFNSSLDGNVRRAIDIREGEAIDEAALKALVRAAVALNTSAKAGRAAKTSTPRAATPKKSTDGHRIYKMSFARVYPLLVAKAEKKGRTKAEVGAVIAWLTGYGPKDLASQLARETDCETFFAEAPAPNPSRALITGVVCGVRVENIAEPTMREIRYLDKLVDELAKGRPMEKILRKG